MAGTWKWCSWVQLRLSSFSPSESQSKFLSTFLKVLKSMFFSGCNRCNWHQSLSSSLLDVTTAVPHAGLQFYEPLVHVLQNWRIHLLHNVLQLVWVWRQVVHLYERLVVCKLTVLQVLFAVKCPHTGIGVVEGVLTHTVWETLRHSRAEFRTGRVVCWTSLSCVFNKEKRSHRAIPQWWSHLREERLSIHIDSWQVDTRNVKKGGSKVYVQHWSLYSLVWFDARTTD